jgi:hypothetical protein
MKAYAIYRVTTGEFRTTFYAFLPPESTVYEHQLMLQLFYSKQGAQDIINILAQLPEKDYDRDQFNRVIKPTRIERCKEEYEIVEIEVDENDRSIRLS